MVRKNMLQARKDFLPYYLQMLEGMNTDFFPTLQPEPSYEDVYSKRNQDFIQISRGLMRYVDATYPLHCEKVKANIVWHRGSACVLDPFPHASGEPLLIFPGWSLGYNFYALTSSHHFLNFLKKRGLRPFFFRRQGITPDEYRLTSHQWFHAYVEGAFNALCQKLESAPLVMGTYGGVYDALFLNSRHVLKGCLTLGLPPQSDLEQHPGSHKMILSLLKGWGHLPWFCTRTFLSLGQHQQIMEKFRHFGEHSSSSQQNEALFFHAEDALNQMNALPAFMAQSILSPTFLEDFFKESCQPSLSINPTCMLRSDEESSDSSFLLSSPYTSHRLCRMHVFEDVSPYAMMLSPRAAPRVWSFIASWFTSLEQKKQIA